MRLAALVAAVALTIVAFPNVAAAQPDHHANSKKAEMHLSSPLTVGTTTLKAGDYKFQCIRFGDKDFLIVTTVEDGKEVARVPCRPEELMEKPSISEMRTVPDGDGGRVLSGVLIRGEKIAHRVVTN
jgi:hypothetical protein